MMFVPHRKHEWAYMSCYGDSFTFLYADDVRTSQETRPWISTASYGASFNFQFLCLYPSLFHFYVFSDSPMRSAYLSGTSLPHFVVMFRRRAWGLFHLSWLLLWRMPSSEMWHPVNLVRTDVPEENVTSIFRVKIISKWHGVFFFEKIITLKNCVFREFCKVWALLEPTFRRSVAFNL
jgi:hypothetical protein